MRPPPTHSLEPLTAVDLFCGCGGLTTGLRQAGYRVLAALDVDRLAVETYKANHRRGLPEGERVEHVWCTDVRSVRPERFMEAVGLVPGELDLLAGCPPCEGFSRLRTRNGSVQHEKDRKKNDLVFAYLDFVRVLLPKAVMMENVPALAADERMVRVLRELAALGYAVDLERPEETVAVLDAASFAVPQRRRRMILMTGRGFPIAFAKEKKARRTVREAFETIGTAPTCDWVHHHGERRTERVREIIRSVDPDGGGATTGRSRCHTRSNGFHDVYGRMQVGRRLPDDHERVHEPLERPLPPPRRTQGRHPSGRPPCSRRSPRRTGSSGDGGRRGSPQ